MPATYHTCAEIGLVYSETRGLLRGDEMVAHTRALAADPNPRIDAVRETCCMPS
jgi:hypothetical protein